MEVNDGSAQKNKVPQDEWFFRLTKRSETVLFFSKCRQRRDVVFALRGPDVKITWHKLTHLYWHIHTKKIWSLLEQPYLAYDDVKLNFV